MPGRNGNGPFGAGLRLGQRAGFCNNDMDNHESGRCFDGYGHQRRYKRKMAQTGTQGCLRNVYPQNISDSEKKAILRVQEIRLESNLKFVKEQLSDLNNSEVEIQ